MIWYPIAIVCMLANFIAFAHAGNVVWAIVSAVGIGLISLAWRAS